MFLLGNYGPQGVRIRVLQVAKTIESMLDRQLRPLLTLITILPIIAATTIITIVTA